MDQLALFGGKPARKTPFKSNVLVGPEEKRQISSVLKAKEFSRFMGSATPDIEKVLRMPSAEAVSYSPQYFTYLGGRKVREFERDFAKHMGSKYAISVNSATSGLTAAVLALGLEPGDEVLMPAISFHASAAAVVAACAVPVFCDISPRDYGIDPEAMEKKLSPRTRAILVVHLLGAPAQIAAIMAFAKKHKLKVIEDCAQSPGTKAGGRHVGTIGDLGVFSLQETKNITTGEGGMITTDDAELVARCRMIRNHAESVPDDSWTPERLAGLIGYNFRMTELTAALGVAQLKRLEKNNALREKNARYLRKHLAGLPGLEIPATPEGSICHVLAMLYDEKKTGVPRVNIAHAARAEGIPIGTGYSKPMYLHPLFSKRVAFGTKGFPFTARGENGHGVWYKKGDCPIAEDLLARRFLWFFHVNAPNGKREMNDVVRAFKKIWANLDALKDWDPAGRKLAYKW